MRFVTGSLSNRYVTRRCSCRRHCHDYHHPPPLSSASSLIVAADCCCRRRHRRRRRIPRIFSVAARQVGQ